MPVYCCIRKCRHNSTACTFKRFPPTSSTLCEAWIKSIKEFDGSFVHTEHQRVCSCHFSEKHFIDTPNKRLLKKNAVPDVFLQTKTKLDSESEETAVNIINVDSTDNFTDHGTPPEVREKVNDTVGKLRKLLPKSAAITQPKAGPNSAEGRSTNEVPAGEPSQLDPLLSGKISKTPCAIHPKGPCMEPACKQHVCVNAVLESSASTPHENLLASHEPSLPANQLTSEELFEIATCDDPRCVREKLMLIVEKQKLQRKVHNLEKNVYNLKKNYSKLQQKYANVFNKDQVELLSKGRVRKWGKDTIKDALKLKFTSGVTGYKMIAKKYPLPSYSSLTRRVQKVPLDPGISTYIVDLMKKKGEKMQDEHRFAAISLDEMELKPASQYDQARKLTVGKCTLGDTSCDANKLLVLVARGLTVKWKQTIGWELTSDAKGMSPSGQQMLDFVLKGVVALEEAGYKVISVASDMGSANQAMWREAGITCNQENESPSIPNPCRPEAELFFMADTPHTLKSSRSGFLKYDLQLPSDIVNANNLPTDVVSSSWLHKLLDVRNAKYCEDEDSEDEEQVFVAANHLNKRVLCPEGFDVMRVSLARSLFSDKTAVALELAVEKRLLPKDALSTAWFIRQMSQWFEMMTSRNRKQAITRQNSMEKFKFLESIIYLFKNLKNSHLTWKPYQTGIILSTLSTIKICSVLLNDLKFVLTSRFTQDAVENLFSVVRCKGNKTPTPLEALRALRLISVAQFTAEVKTSNYDNAGDEEYLDFLNSPIKKANTEYPLPSFHDYDEEDDLNPVQVYNFAKLGILEEDVLAHLAGYLIKKIKKKICQNCLEFCVDNNTDHIYPESSSMTALSNKGGLTFASEQAIIATKLLEMGSKKKMVNCVYDENFLEMLCCKGVKLLEAEVFPRCKCNLVWHFCHLFYRCRTYFYLRKENVKTNLKRKNRNYSSRSVDDSAKRRCN